MFENYYQITDIYSLRKYCPDDAREITKLKKDNRKYLPFLTWMRYQKFTISESLDYIQAKASEWERGKEWTFAILYNTTIIGDFQIRRAPNDPYAIELGYWIDYRYRLRNIATTIIEFVLSIAKDLGFCKAVIIADPNNIPSVNLALKLRFSQIQPINPYNDIPGLVTFIRNI